MFLCILGMKVFLPYHRILELLVRILDCSADQLELLLAASSTMSAYQNHLVQEPYDRYILPLSTYLKSEDLFLALQELVSMENHILP